MQRQRVLKLFRDMLRCVRSIDNNKELQTDLKSQILIEFTKGKVDTDAMSIKNRLIEGQRNLDILRSVCSSSPGQHSVNSWMNTTDDADKRGRIGEGWPWTSK